MKRIKIGLIAAVLVGIVALYSYIDKASPIYDRQIDSSMYGSTGGLLDGEIRQSFTVEEDALDGFAVKSSVSGETDGLTLEYELSDAASGEIVREGSVKAPKIKNGKFYKIKFEETVAESSGKEWELALRVKGASAEHNLAFFYTAGEGAGSFRSTAMPLTAHG